MSNYYPTGDNELDHLIDGLLESRNFTNSHPTPDLTENYIGTDDALLRNEIVNNVADIDSCQSTELSELNRDNNDPSQIVYKALERAEYFTNKLVDRAERFIGEHKDSLLEPQKLKKIIVGVVGVGVLATAVALKDDSDARRVVQNEGVEITYDKASASIGFDVNNQDIAKSRQVAASVAGIPEKNVKIDSKSHTIQFSNIDKLPKERIEAAVIAAAALDDVEDNNSSTTTTTSESQPTASDAHSLVGTLDTQPANSEIKEVNRILSSISIGKKNNLDDLVQAVTAMDKAYAPNDKDRPEGMPSSYIKMPLLNEAVGLAVPYTVAERTANNERYTSPHMVATLLATAKIYQDLIHAEFPQLKGDIFRIRDQNSPAHNKHNNGLHADISGGFGFDVTQYSTGAFADYKFSKRFNKEFTERLLIEMSQFYTEGRPVIDKVLSSGKTMVPEINQKVDKRYMVSFNDHKDHGHIQLRPDLALSQWRIRANDLPWTVDQDLRIGGMAQPITDQQKQSQHGKYEQWIIKHLNKKQENDGQMTQENDKQLKERSSKNVESDTNITDEVLSPKAKEVIDSLNLPDGHKAFLRKMLPGITTVYRRGAHINPAVVLAQTSIETGFGQDELSNKTNNYFGIKAGKNWQGKIYNTDTKEEFVPGNVVTIVDGFRVYNSPAESVADYAKLIEGSKHYADAVKNYKNDLGYVNGLFNEVDDQGNIIKAQGEEGVLSYGTDRGYVDKVMKVIEKDEYDKLVEAQLGEPSQQTTITSTSSTTTTSLATGQDKRESNPKIVNQDSSIWIDKNTVIDVFSSYFSTTDGSIDKQALNDWVKSLEENKDGKVLIKAKSLSDIKKGQK